MHGLQRTHPCPCAPTQIQAAVARFPTPAVPELQAHLVQAQPVRLELPVPRVRSAVLERLVLSVQVLLGHSVG